MASPFSAPFREVPRSAFRQPFTRRPAAMPRSDPLSCLEAEVSRLTGALALRERDIARLMSRLKSSEAQIWVLRRRNSVLAAAQEKRSCTIAAITCQSSWSKQATVLESFCARWQLGDLPELFLRVLQRQKLPDERECSLLSPTEREGHVFDRLRAAMYLERDWQVAGHLQRVWSAELMETLRLCIGLSYNKTMWLESNMKFAWEVNEEGKSQKQRLLLAPDSKVPLPCPFTTARMREIEPEILSGEAANEQSSDRRAAWVKCMDYQALELVRTTPMTKAGAWATKGTKEDPHGLLVTLDGLTLTNDGGAVSAGIMPGTVEKLNQSCPVILYI